MNLALNFKVRPFILFWRLEAFLNDFKLNYFHQELKRWMWREIDALTYFRKLLVDLELSVVKPSKLLSYTKVDGLEPSWASFSSKWTVIEASRLSTAQFIAHGSFSTPKTANIRLGQCIGGLSGRKVQTNRHLDHYIISYI